MTQLIDNIAIPTFVLNKTGVITHWNKALARLSHLPSASMIGTRGQWRPFYAHARPTLADLILQQNTQATMNQFYNDKYQHCDLLEGAFAAEDFFPEVGNDGEWLAFTAAPIHDDHGNVVGAIETLLNISTRKRAELALLEREQHYRELSMIDELTQLYNSRYFFLQLQREVERCSRYRHSLSLCMLDLDHFKRLNDRYGHPFGNQVLAAVGTLIKRHLRTSDSGYRFGGEEFVLLMPAISDAAMPTERIREELEKNRFVTDADVSVQVTVSIGIASYADGDDDNSLLQRADQAMYLSKQAGRNRVTCINV